MHLLNSHRFRTTALLCCTHVLFETATTAVADCELQELVPSASSVAFGLAVAMDGNTAIVGAKNEDVLGIENSGAAYIFFFDGVAWAQQGKLVASDLEPEDYLGQAVAIDGDVAIAGRTVEGPQPGAVYTFERTASVWSQQQILTPWDSPPPSWFGFSVAMGGSYIAVGAPAPNTGAGAVYVYKWDGASWVPDEVLSAEVPVVNSQFGWAIAMHGDELVVVSREDGSGDGAIHVFRRDVGGWTESATFVEPSSYAETVAFDGTTIVCGVPRSHGLANIWTRQGDDWGEPVQIVASERGASDLFGSGVAVADGIALIGAPGVRKAGCPRLGAVYWFSRVGSDWEEVTRTTLSGDPCTLKFGSDVAFSGGSAAIVGQLSGAHILDTAPGLDCNGNGVDDDCETAEADCNVNGVPDDCDLDTGTSIDCNGNGRPDDCESDCNVNTVPDDCDVSSGASEDCNGNGIPDECDPDCDEDGITDECDPFAPCFPADTCTLALKSGVGYYYGSAVSIGGGSAFVGARDDGDCGVCVGGKVHAYRLEGPNLVSEGEITAGATQTTLFGEFIAVHGTTGFVQDASFTRVMKRGDNGWSLDSTIVAFDRAPMAFDGTHVVGRFGTGARVLAEQGGAWTVVAELEPSDPAADGGGVAIDGNTIVLGPFVFEYDGKTWVQTAQLEKFGYQDNGNPDPFLLGRTASISGDTIALGQSGCCTTALVSAYVYRNVAGAWTPEARFSFQNWYARVALENDTLLVAHRSRIHLLQRDGSTWGTRKLIDFAEVSGAAPGIYPALDGGVALLGSALARRAWFLGVGEDCDMNGVADMCDFQSTGIPVSCVEDYCIGGANEGSPCLSDAQCSGGLCGGNGRYVRIDSEGIASRGGTTHRTLKLEIMSMPQFPANVGDVWWAGPQQQIPSGPSATVMGAPLVCEALPSHEQIWGPSALSLFGSVIVPESEYEVSLCDGNGANCSVTYRVATGKWGDLVAPFVGNGLPDFRDIAAAVSTFLEAAAAPSVQRADLVGITESGEPNEPDHDVNFRDIGAAVEAFLGNAYPYAVPRCP